MLRLVYVIGIFGITLGGCTNDKEELPAPKTLCDTLKATYSGVIAPLISAQCSMPGCHSAGFLYGDFTTHQGVKEKEAEIRERVLIQKTMPPSGPLPPAERQQIECWLNKGAPNN